MIPKKNKTKNITTAAALAIAITAAAGPYRIIVPLSPDDEGAMVRLVNYDTGTTVDSVLAGQETAVFTGNIDEPIPARVMIEGTRISPFILESGTISFSRDRRSAFGTMLNDQLRDFNDKAHELQRMFSATSVESEHDAIYRRFNSIVDSMTVANADNPLGYYMFFNGDVSTMTSAELRAELERFPALAGYKRMQTMLQMAERRDATQPGGQFVDFEVVYDGRSQKLSDYVGKGKYTLVDFWASWCGPCVRQLPVIKDLYNRWHDKGLEVLGVAVWDQPDDTKRAIADHELPWPCFIDTQSVPTDLYGISGIPCIILFGPDGKIISRDKQGDELKADVDAAMSAL